MKDGKFTRLMRKRRNLTIRNGTQTGEEEKVRGKVYLGVRKRQRKGEKKEDGRNVTYKNRKIEK